MMKRVELIELCRQEPEKMADLILSLEARIQELERRTKKNSKNSDQPPSSDGLKKPPQKNNKSKRKPGGQEGRPGKTLRYSEEPDQIVPRASRLNPPNLRSEGQRGRVAQSTERNLIDRLTHYKSAYLRFVFDFRVPFDNNLAERDLRMSKLQQKIAGSFRTEAGAHHFCRIRGYISTLRKHATDLLPALVSLWSPTPFLPAPAE